ncbi:MAG: AAA family ATPase, partial [Myxococcota bacterium]
MPDLSEVADSPASFVGREPTLRQVSTALAQARWVLLVGPGGMGKTRLARRVAAATPDSVWWVDAATATTALELAASVAAVLDVPVSDDTAIATVGHALAVRGRLLLVLDNLEQARDALADVVGPWLARAPETVLLGTSRVRTGLDGEVTIELPALEPDEGLELFVQRAMAASPSFRLGRVGREPVLELVSRLDGLPLAIELAAARSPVVGPAELLARLHRRLDVLQRPRGRVARHRTLRAAFQGSIESLGPQERQAFLVMALFVRPFDLGYAEDLFGDAALDLVQELRDRSLLQARGDSFEVLESLRELAAEERAVEPDGGRELELAWVRRLARLGTNHHRHALELEGADAALSEQRRRLDDLLTAARLAIAWREADLAVDCALGAATTTGQRGPHQPAIDVFRAVVEVGPSRVAALRHQEGYHLLLLSRFEEAMPVLEDAVEQATLEGDDHALGQALHRLASASDLTSHHERRLMALQRGADALERAGRATAAAIQRAKAADALDQHEDRHAYLRHAVDASREAGNLRMGVAAGIALAQYERDHGRPLQANRRLARAARGATEMGLWATLLYALNHRAYVMAFVGDPDFDAIYERAVKLAREMGRGHGIQTIWAYA